MGLLSKGLDIVSSVLLEPTTFIKSPAKAGEKVAARRAKISAGDKKEAVKVIGETVSSTVLAGSLILGGGTAGGRAFVAKVAPRLVPNTIPKAVGVATGAGILLTSKTARKGVGKFIEDPTSIGRGAGEAIEKARKGEAQGVIDALKTGGLIGAGVAAGAGAVAGASKVKSIFSGGKTPSSTPPSAALPTTTIPTQALSSPSSVPVITPSKEASTSSPSVVVNNNIKINNRSSANRRFINNVNI